MMLELPELDNEQFSDIMARAVGRIPSLCAEWTDFNAHDPGITLVELFAWYKEMQQYHLNQITQQDLRMLLRILGIYPRRIRSTRVRLLGKPDGLPRVCYPGQSLRSAGGVPFELEERVDFGGRGLKQAYLEWGDTVSDVTELLTGGRVPLRLTQENTLLLGLRGVEGMHELKLWMWVLEEYPVPRNPFGQDSMQPRTIAYDWMAQGKAYPFSIRRDETHGLCFSGGLHLTTETPLKAGHPGSGIDDRDASLVWIRVRITHAGCEEPPALRGISGEYAMAVQRQTKVECHCFSVSPGKIRVQVCSRLADGGTPEVLARRAAGGWVMIPCPRTVSVEQKGLRTAELSFYVSDLARDGQNLRVIYRDGVYPKELSTGLPGQRIPLLQPGEKVALDTLKVMCRENGAYYDWRYVDSFMEADARDRVYTLDGENTLVFGDNRNGAVPEADALYIAGLAATLGGDGQLPAGQALYVQGEDQPLGTAAGVCLGRSWESPALAARRLDHIWEEHGRIVTAADYEQAALCTPGRRVAAAKALPLYEPGQQFRSRAAGTLTVVVVPYAEHPRPMPDEGFLESVRTHLESCRVICTRLIVTAPLYLPLKVQAEIVCAGDGERPLYEQAWDCLWALIENRQEFGGMIRRGDIIAALGELEQVAGVREVALHAPQCRHTEQGELVLPEHAIPWLEALELRETQKYSHSI